MNAASHMTRLRVVALSAATLMAMLASGSPARAVSPWLHIDASARPSRLQAGLAKDEVQQVTVSATGGEFILVEPSHFRTATFKFDADAGEVQTGLEALYGAGNIQVTGGPGDETGSSPYVLTFVGALADRPVAPMLAFSGLTGGRAEATVTELTKGADDGEVIVLVSNLGDAEANGETTPLQIADTLPAGLRPVTIEAVAGETPGDTGNRGPVQCTVTGLKCQFTGTLPSYDSVEVRIGVVVEPGYVSGESNEAQASGGDAAQVRASDPIGQASSAFGLESFQMSAEEEGGERDTQAGSHPFQLTTDLTFTQTGEANPVQLPKDAGVELPPGLVGNVTSIARCSLSDFLQHVENRDRCPADTAVGVAQVTANVKPAVGINTYSVPVFNLEPARGEPARFGFYLAEDQVGVTLDTSVRTGGDYGVTVSAQNIPETVSTLQSLITLWGAPGDPRHDDARGWGCMLDARGQGGECASSEEVSPPALLTLPSSCSESMRPTLSADSWAQPGDYLQIAADEEQTSLDGCNRESFSPSVTLKPESGDASSPSGLLVDMHVPQDASSNPAGVAEADVRGMSLTLPAGMQLNPSAADGLSSCSLGQAVIATAGPSGCPEDAKVGVVEEIKTPLLADPLKGSLYLAAQDENPFGSLVALYLVAEEPVAGVRIKLAGDVALDPRTGQITTTFQDTPQLPFEELRLRIFGGTRAPLSTPPSCGSYKAQALVSSWSERPAAASAPSFQVDSGPDGAPCTPSRPFAPTLTSGATSSQAGAPTTFVTTIAREDGEQIIGGVSLRLPEGLLGKLPTVQRCAEPLAAQGACPPGSLIGQAQVSAGVGPNPVTLGGQVFLTGPYRGAPFGLSIVVPVKAGPFDLGEEVVRAAVGIDPHTSEVTVQSDPLPQIKDGIPFQLKRITVTVDRPGFLLNPTNCSLLHVSGSIQSGDSALSAPVSEGFEVTNCATLPFKPRLVARSQARTSRAGGAALTVHIDSGSGQANIGKVKVVLPKQLPARNSTLRQACPVATFEASPVRCPTGSVVGSASVQTPLLGSRLRGPAYLVSHGGEAFPDLEMVLQGEGVTLILDGQTHIDGRTGITSSMFRSVPDAPITSFELTLSRGPHSALGAYGSLCKHKLKMPTEMTGQNGATLKQETTISVAGCPRHRRAGSRA